MSRPAALLCLIAVCLTPIIQGARLADRLAETLDEMSRPGAVEPEIFCGDHLTPMRSTGNPSLPTHPHVNQATPFEALPVASRPSVASLRSHANRCRNLHAPSFDRLQPCRC
jgi:hypothetical protein